MLMAYIKHVRMRTYQRSIEEGASGPREVDRTGTAQTYAPWDLALRIAAPYRVRKGCATEEGGHAFSKNDMGESRNGIARSGDRTKLAAVDQFRLHHRRRRVRGMRARRSPVRERARSRAGSRGRRIGLALLDQDAHRLRPHLRRPNAVNWKYQTAASPGLNGRTMYWPRGRVVGGSSSINALVYCRGMPADFDDWRAMGQSAGAGRTCAPISKDRSAAWIPPATRDYRRPARRQRRDPLPASTYARAGWVLPAN
jgi:choline dehydrogenase-like flavoprotein